MGDLARLMTLEGGGVLLVLVWLVVRLEWIRSENTNAHRAIAKNIDDFKKDVRKDIDDFKQDVRKSIDDLRRNIDDVKQDVRMLINHLLERKPAGPDA